MLQPEPIRIAHRLLALHEPSYFIADIATNHDGDLARAKDLIWLAKAAGADCAKFAHFKPDRIVSERGLRALGGPQGHPASGSPQALDVYRQTELNREWNIELVATARAARIDFMTTPHDEDAVDSMNALVPAWAIGSGDITFSSFIDKVARTGKPVMLATGASTQADVDRAVKTVLAVNRQLVLMQCNTSCGASIENFGHINLAVLKTYALRYPGVLLGFSDNSPGHATVLGAITLGARAIEKPFTDDNQCRGPDDAAAMNARSWREMVQRSRELQAALGDGVKRVEANEVQAVVLQQRCLRAARDLPAGHVLAAGDLESLRPAPDGAARPHELPQLLGRHLLAPLAAGDALHAAALAVRTPADAALSA